MSELPIGNGFYVSDSLPLSHQECTNFYVNIPEVPALSKETLFGTSGITQIATTGAVQQINRGSRLKGAIPYFVNGSSLYNLILTYTSDGSEIWTVNNLGTITGSGRVSLAHNDTQLMILVPGGKGYIYNEDASPAFAEIVDLDFKANGNPEHVLFIDGYFVCTTDTKKVIHSNLNDGLTWSALDKGTAESDPDAIVAPIKANNQLTVIGTITAEGMENIGGDGFAFKRNNIFLDKGSTSPFALLQANQTFFMIGNGKDESPAIWQFDGNNFQKISSLALDALLAKCSTTNLNEAFGLYYGTKGHYFLVFTFGAYTFSYDLVTKRWHQRKSTILEEQERWRVNSIVSAYGYTIVADSVDGRIGIMSEDTYGEYGEDIISVFSLQPFFEEEGFSVPLIEMTAENGVGNATVVDPQVSMAISRDNITFSAERGRSLGKIGEYEKKIEWRRNGRTARFLTLRFRISDQVKKRVLRLGAN